MTRSLLLTSSMFICEGLSSVLISNLSFHLEEKIVMHLRFDILVMCLSSVVIYLELGQAVLPQEVDESEGLLAPPPAQLRTLQVDV